MYCPECGVNHHAADTATEPEAVVVEEAPTEEETRADVEVARIEADKEIKLAKIGADVAKDEMTARIEALEGELRGMRETLDRIAPPPEPEPEPEPEPVVVVDNDDAGSDENEMPPREDKPREPRPAPRKTGFFS